MDEWKRLQILNEAIDLVLAKRSPARWQMLTPLVQCLACRYVEPQGTLEACEVCPVCSGPMVPERWH